MWLFLDLDRVEVFGVRAARDEVNLGIWYDTNNFVKVRLGNDGAPVKPRVHQSLEPWFVKL